APPLKRLQSVLATVCCEVFCSLTIWNKLKFETTQLNIIREDSDFVVSESLKNRSHEMFSVRGLSEQFKAKAHSAEEAEWT
ncbi:hypothetical protein, partial [Brenneria tiliae]